MTSVQNECVPLYEVGRRITIIADGAVTGRRAVKVNASKVQGSSTTNAQNLHVIQAVAGDRPDGIAVWDLLTGETGGMIRDGVVPVDAGATVTAGQEVQIDATGRVITLAAGKSIGKAWTDATVGNPCYVALSL